MLGGNILNSWIDNRTQPEVAAVREFGLGGSRRRRSQADGSVHIASASGQATTIRLRAPGPGNDHTTARRATT
jgi:hypothetical protein